MNRGIILVTFAIALTIVFFVTNNSISNETNTNDKLTLSTHVGRDQFKPSVAVCPTYYQLSEKLDPDIYKVIKTRSTTESIYLLNNGSVNYILSGRTLKPGEPNLVAHVVKTGYSLISSKEMSINEKDLIEYELFTDQNKQEIGSILALKKITSTSNVYNHIEKGIAVTTWENTDHSRAKMVHIFNDNGERLAASRRPTLYCKNPCPPETEQIVNLIQ